MFTDDFSWVLITTGNKQSKRRAAPERSNFYSNLFTHQQQIECSVKPTTICYTCFGVYCNLHNQRQYIYFNCISEWKWSRESAFVILLRHKYTSKSVKSAIIKNYDKFSIQKRKCCWRQLSFFSSKKYQNLSMKNAKKLNFSSIRNTIKLLDWNKIFFHQNQFGSYLNFKNPFCKNIIG